MSDDAGAGQRESFRLKLLAAALVAVGVFGVAWNLLHWLAGMPLAAPAALDSGATAAISASAAATGTGIIFEHRPRVRTRLTVASFLGIALFAALTAAGGFVAGEWFGATFFSIGTVLALALARQALKGAAGDGREPGDDVLAQDGARSRDGGR